ncbi:MAG: hypothetical protein PHN42_03075 [Bacilli bacterium]|nr:hypothetical protein [Bacilli bacterium]
MNSRKKRRVLLSLLTIALVGVVLSTSTYAWFTANKTVTVSDINVNVAASNGIQVSVDGINWKTVISNDDITNAATTYPAATNQLPSVSNSLTPVSTVGTIDTTSGFLEMFSGAIDSNAGGDYILTATRSTETNGTGGSFIAFDLFMQVTESTNVYLTSNSNVVASGTSTGIENAARMAFVLQNTTAVGSPVATIQGLKATTGTENVVLWELNNDTHTAAAVSNASSNYALTTLAGSGNTPLAYYGVKSEITKANDVLLNSHSATYFDLVTPDISTALTGIPTTAYQSAFTLPAGITKVRVYMWLEGQDVDCENNASGGSVTFSAQFSSNTAA